MIDSDEDKTIEMIIEMSEKLEEISPELRAMMSDTIKSAQRVASKHGVNMDLVMAAFAGFVDGALTAAKSERPETAAVLLGAIQESLCAETAANLMRARGTATEEETTDE